MGDRKIIEIPKAFEKPKEKCCPIMGMLPIPNQITRDLELRYMPCNKMVCRFFNDDKEKCNFDILFAEKNIDSISN